eukprot:3944935-Pyramimonas_sp.AAC.1
MTGETGGRKQQEKKGRDDASEKKQHVRASPACCMHLSSRWEKGHLEEGGVAKEDDLGGSGEGRRPG